MTTEEDVISDYYTSLQELECNSKPHINMLTMLAEESQRFAPKIVQLVESHIQKVTTNQKLPVLYLIDSIVKNCPDTQYKELFSKNLINIFVHVFDQVDEKTRQALYRLRTTWPNIFPASKLYGIDIKVHEIDPAWPLQNPNQLKASAANVVNSSSSSSSTKHVHVNPKFIDQKGQKVSEQQEISEGMVVSSEGQITAEKVRCEELVRLKEELQKTRENMIASVGGPLRINKKPVDLSVRDVENKEKLSSSERVSLKDNPMLRSTSKTSAPFLSSKENENSVESDCCSVESFQSISSYVVCDEHDSLSPHSQLPSESPDQPFISVDEEEAGESSDDPIVVVDIVEMDDEPPSKVQSQTVNKQSNDEKLPNQLSTRNTEYSKKSLHDTKNFSSSRRSSERRDRRRHTRSPDYSPRSSVEKRSRHGHRSRQIDRDGRGRRFSRDERSRSPLLSPVGRRRRSPPVRRRYDSDRSLRMDKSHTSSSSSSRPAVSSSMKKGGSSSAMLSSSDVRESGRLHGDSKKSRLHNEDTSLPMPVAKKERPYKPPPVPVDLEEPKAPLSNSSLFGNESDQERGLGVDGLKFPPVPLRPATSAVSVNVNPMDGMEYRSRSPGPLVTPMTTPVNSALENRAIIFQRAQKQLADGILNQREYDDLIRDLTDVIGRVRPPDAPMNSVRSMIVGDVWNPEVSVNSKTLGSAGRLVTPIQAPASTSGVSLLALPEQECKAPPLSIEFDLSENKTGGPSNDRIFVDGHGYEVRYVDEVAVIERNGLPHRISFTGCAKEVIVDGIAYSLAFGDSRVITLDGQPVVIRFGAPARELYFGNVPLRGIFGGPPIFIKVNGVKHSILLGGPPPEVKIDTEPSYELLRFLHSGHMGRRGMMRQDVRASLNIGKRLQNNNRCEPVAANIEIPKPPPAVVAHVNTGAISNTSSNSSVSVNVGGGGGAAGATAPSQMTPDAIRALLNRIKQVGLLPDNPHSVKPSTVASAAAAMPMPVTTWFPDDETVERRKEPTTELKTFNMKYLKMWVRYQSLIDALYQNKIQCSTCGMRFAVGDSQKYSKHLDWHFKMNRREKAGITASSRPWYLASEVCFVIFFFHVVVRFTNDSIIRIGSITKNLEKIYQRKFAVQYLKRIGMRKVVDREICQVCNETFEQFWDGDEEVWKLRNAMLVDGKVYHPLCYQDAGIESASSSFSNTAPTFLEEKKTFIGATGTQTEKGEVKLMKEVVVKLEEQNKSLQSARSTTIKPTTLPCENLVKSILTAIKGSSEEVVGRTSAAAIAAEKVDQC
ncbi:Pre-mRNA cleavage complex 2 protein Pcf11 [Trichinella sp. T8]|nr:Pre-mRNA cleavage complex 2 protein Pcf11 [Trichinella sp. T8]